MSDLKIPGSTCIVIRDRKTRTIYLQLSANAEAFERAFVLLIDPTHRYHNPFRGEWEVYGDEDGEEAIRLCKEYFETIKTNLVRPQLPPGVPRERKPTAPEIMRGLFELNPLHVDETYKLLARMFHPDLGGKSEHMTALNQVYDQMKGRA